MCREPSIELYRTILMFGICLLHVFGKGAEAYDRIVYLLLFTVDAFVFITGFYGVRFSIKRIVSLLATTMYCLLIVGILNRYIFDVGLIETIHDVWKGMWFVQGYILLLLFSPMINAVIDGFDRRVALMALCPVLFAVFGWGWASTLPVLRRVVPLQPGLTAYSGLTLIGVYIAARLIRSYCVCGGGVKIPHYWLLVGTLVVVPFALFGFARYNSPFALLLASITFIMFRQIHVGEFVGKILPWIVPSLFSVYLIHANGVFGFRCIRELTMRWDGLSGCFMTAIVVFIGGIVLDIPRRIVVSVWKKVVGCMKECQV